MQASANLESGYQDDSMSYSGRGQRSARRSRMDICFDVLEATWNEGSIGPTQLMYRTNLSWKMTSSVLDFLIKNGLMSSTKSGLRQRLSITEDGTECLKHLHGARELLIKGLSSSTVKANLPAREPVLARSTIGYSRYEPASNPATW